MEKYVFNDVEFALLERSCIPFAIYQFIDMRVVALVVSEGFCQQFDFERAEAYELMNNNMYRDVHPDDVARISDAAFRFATEDQKYDVIYRAKVDEAYHIVHAYGKHMYPEEGTRIAVVWYNDEGAYSPTSEASEVNLNQTLSRALHEESLYQQNYFDGLTGLPNMAYFFDLAEAGRKRMLEEGKEPALLFINLNGMKFYNRKYGFAKGNDLIRSVAKVLLRFFSSENCSRFGQDHFVVLTEARGLEGRLEELFYECWRINDGKSLPVRVGIYLDSVEAVDVSTACDRAKYACDLNREAYVSGYRYFDESTLSDEEMHRYIIDHIDQAIEEGWIQVYYQAIVRTANGCVSDEEALARWIDPTKGFLSPAEFIPVLESSKLIYKLDLYVIDQVLRKMVRQKEEGLYVVPNSVNLSRTDFDEEGFVDEVCRRVDAAGIPRVKLTIEITESVVGSDFLFMKSQVKRFQELGFKVWMDDFGSGYSSLDVLQNIHFDLIKLDMRFMERFDKGDESKIILTELVRMAMGLSIDTLAEGVETREQVDFLREIGCNRLQGFYFTKPIPLDVILERRNTNTLIGFENPEESEYYASIGRINLYDSSAISHEDHQTVRKFFDTIPMAIIETKDGDRWVTRCNRSYREFMKLHFGLDLEGASVFLPLRTGQVGSLFDDALAQCATSGDSVVLDDETSTGDVTHIFISRIDINPVTGTTAMLVAILAVMSKNALQPSVTYAHIARVLSSDYRYIFYVDLETERFVEYSSSNTRGDLAVERHGMDFFRASREDSLRLLHEDDRSNFRKQFTRENVVRSIDENGAFILTYRHLVDGVPRYMNMKAMRMGANDSHIIIGVSDIDAQVRQQESYERMRSMIKERGAVMDGVDQDSREGLL